MTDYSDSTSCANQKRRYFERKMKSILRDRLSTRHNERAGETFEDRDEYSLKRACECSFDAGFRAGERRGLLKASAKSDRRVLSRAASIAERAMKMLDEIRGLAVEDVSEGEKST